MSIPDLEILKNYVLTLDCGHRRRTSAPCSLGHVLPCLDESHKMERHAVTKITHVSGRELESIGWLSPQAALLGAHDDLRSDAEAVPRWRWLKRRKLRADAREVGLAGAMIGIRSGR